MASPAAPATAVEPGGSAAPAAVFGRDARHPTSAGAAAVLRRIERGAGAAATLAALLQTISGALWPVQAWVLAQSVAHWLMIERGAAQPAVPMRAALVFAALGLARAALEYHAGGTIHRAADRVLAAERERALQRESRRGADLGASAGEAAATMAEKLPLILPYLTRLRPARMRLAILPVLIVALSAYWSWAAALILLATGPVIPVFMVLIGQTAQKASLRQLHEIGDLSRLLGDRLGALLDIRLLGAEARNRADFARRTEALHRRTMAVLRIAFLSSAVLELFAAVGVAMTAIYVGFSLLGVINIGVWGTALTPANGIFLLLLAPAYFQPMRDFAATWHDRAAAQALARELAQAESTGALQQRVLGDGAAAVPLPGALRLRAYGLVAAGAGGALRLPDLELGAGESVALSGPSGSGKSTYIALLSGLAQPLSGWIELAGTALCAENADAWRARLAWIGQTPYFLDLSLAENLDLRRRNLPLGPALRAARAEAVVAGLPGGLDARLGVGGGGVSGGEARRLTIARALASGADLVLADEPTADLDPASRDDIIAGLRALQAQGAALVVASHDPRVIAAMDREIVLERAR